MKKKTIKDWCKEWSIKDIVDNIFSEGMGYMAERFSTKEVKEYKKIMVDEIERRFKNLKKK